MTGTIEDIRCSCWTAMSTSKGYLFCEHCDKPCSVKNCDACNHLRKAASPKGQ